MKTTQNLVKVTTIINGNKIKDNFVHNLPENRELSDYARKHRRSGNTAEIVFWLQVHKKSFHGLDFDRQKVIKLIKKNNKCWVVADKKTHIKDIEAYLLYVRKGHSIYVVITQSDKTTT